MSLGGHRAFGAAPPPSSTCVRGAGSARGWRSPAGGSSGVYSHGRDLSGGVTGERVHARELRFGPGSHTHNPLSEACPITDDVKQCMAACYRHYGTATFKINTQLCVQIIFSGIVTAHGQSALLSLECGSASQLKTRSERPRVTLLHFLLQKSCPASQTHISPPRHLYHKSFPAFRTCGRPNARSPTTRDSGRRGSVDWEKRGEAGTWSFTARAI